MSRQTRVGRGGPDFTILKFRTMRVLEGTKKRTFRSSDITRVTVSGRILLYTANHAKKSLFHGWFGSV
ncbi:MAG: sugar transferase [Planctomycetota bacterium]|nr:sugar transferase [Planctomycetota bacterium]